MASLVHDKNRNGNGTTGAAAGEWYGVGLDDVATQQRPRRLSFNGSDMELSDLKAAAAVAATGRTATEEGSKKIEPKQMVGLLAIATTLAVFIKYLLSSFDFALFRTFSSRATATASRVWQDSVQRLGHLRSNVESWSFEKMIPERTESVAHAMIAVAFGLLVSSFTWYVIYLDSSIPGVNPPTPFSASKKRYRGGVTQSKDRRFHLGYITAMVSGVVVALIVLFG